VVDIRAVVVRRVAAAGADILGVGFAEDPHQPVAELELPVPQVGPELAEAQGLGTQPQILLAGLLEGPVGVTQARVGMDNPADRGAAIVTKCSRRSPARVRDTGLHRGFILRSPGGCRLMAVLSATGMKP